MKKILFSICTFLFVSSIFAQTSQQKFIKGNLSDKTAAVREGSEKDNIWLSTHAISFVIDNYQYLEDDRELEGLAVAAILSLPSDYGNSMTDDEKLNVSNQLITMYKQFSKSSTVRIAILSKYLSLRNYIPTEKLTETLNQDLQTSGALYTDPSLTKTIINSLYYIGNNASFLILYNYYSENKFTEYKNELEQTLVSLIPQSINEILKIIHSKNIAQIQKIYELINKNSKISQNFLSEIAENLLNETILIMSNSTEKKSELVAIQLGALKILNDNKCTRASASVLSYFNLAKSEVKDGTITDSQFVEVIYAIGNLAPIDSVNSLINYLEELNKNMEKEQPVSSLVVTAVIKTLGAIGDKSAFDSLLAVTYLNYPDSVLTAARNALSGLKW